MLNEDKGKAIVKEIEKVMPGVYWTQCQDRAAAVCLFLSELTPETRERLLTSANEQKERIVPIYDFICDVGWGDMMRDYGGNFGELVDEFNKCGVYIDSCNVNTTLDTIRDDWMYGRSTRAICNSYKYGGIFADKDKLSRCRRDFVSQVLTRWVTGDSIQTIWNELDSSFDSVVEVLDALGYPVYPLAEEKDLTLKELSQFVVDLDACEGHSENMYEFYPELNPAVIQKCVPMKLLQEHATGRVEISELIKSGILFRFLQGDNILGVASSLHVDLPSVFEVLRYLGFAIPTRNYTYVDIVLLKKIHTLDFNDRKKVQEVVYSNKLLTIKNLAEMKQLQSDGLNAAIEDPARNVVRGTDNPLVVYRQFKDRRKLK